MRKLVLLASYMCLLPCVILAFTGYLLIILHGPSKNADVLTSATDFQEPPKEASIAVYAPQIQEARVEVLSEFFKRYDSPLAAYAQQMVETADKYSLDWRLVPAIAMQESTLCKRIPKRSFNCWGFGIYGGKITRFNNYAEAIERVTQVLAEDYKNKRGLEEPSQIVTRYTPGSGTWADKVSYVMDRIQSNL